VWKCQNRWTGRMPFRAEAPERVDRKVRENAVPCRSAGTGWPKGQGECRSVPKRQNGLTERSGRTPSGAERRDG